MTINPLNLGLFKGTLLALSHMKLFNVYSGVKPAELHGVSLRQVTLSQLIECMAA